MMEEVTIPIDRFIEIVEAEVGKPKWEDTVDGELIKYYKPRSGRGPIAIAVGCDKITNRTARALMRKLKIDDVIIQAFEADYKQTGS